jgi:PAS domain S-box-containing protein
MLIQGADKVRPAHLPVAAPPADGPDGTLSRSAWVPGAITLAGGLLCTAVGVAVMAAWFARATVVVTFGSQIPMVFDTALAFTVTGAALIALARGRPRAVLAAGVFDVLLGVTVLAEYVISRGLGIDQLFVRADVNPPGHPPGRMAFSTALCLLLAGAALLAWSPWRSRRRPAVLAATGSVLAAVAVASAFGYATTSPAASGWTYAVSLSFPTAVTMLVLALSLLSAAWQDSRTDHAGLPGWLPMAVGSLALGLALWQAIDGRAVAAGLISAGVFIGVAAVLGLVLAGVLALAVWQAQQADRRRQAARESENLLFRFLAALPVGVHILSPGGRPYYASEEGERLLGKGIDPGIGADQIAETYSIFRAGTGQRYPTEHLPSVLALFGHLSHADDLEVHRPDGSVIPLETWARPVYGTGGQVDYAIVAFADISVRQAREKIIADQAALLDLAHDAIFVRDPGGRITYWNTGAERTYGYTRAQALGQVSHELLRTQFPEPLPAVEAIAARQERWDGELTHRCADGRLIVVESRWAAQRGPDGTLLGFMEINRDITARKDAERETLRKSDEVRSINATLEQRISERTLHLERANQNLAAFTYTAAHDLRTPLRAVSGYAEVLIEEYGGQLEETGRGYAGRIQGASEQMAAVLDDLLVLSQVSGADMHLQEVDLSAEATAICGQLEARDPGRRARVAVQGGVHAAADRPLIRAVLQELLENAWKFTAGREQAVIEFGATPVSDAPLCCYVRDNGAGFDPAYAGKLFHPFQRLHAASEFPGTGVGLASVKRIIDRHGGRTWAEGAVGGGATFYFTLDTNNAP